MNPKALALALALTLTLGAATLGACGIYILFGLGSALLFLGFCCAAPAAVIVRGLISDG